MAKFTCPTYSSQLAIDLDALRANYRAILDHAQGADCGAVIKADAYGLGARRVASALHDEGCRTFFVAQLCEALDLYPSLPPDSTIIILNGLDPGGEDVCADREFVPLINSISQLQRWISTAARRKRVLPAGLQVDTGMARLGLSEADLRKMANDISLAGHVELRLIMSHLACADEPDAAVNDEQLRRFHELASLFPTVPRSIANSCGTTLSSAYHLEIVRPGIALYGVPFRSAGPAIAPVVSLRARVLQIRELETGSGVGYGLTFHASETRRLATLGIGYADGWPSSLSNMGAAWHGDVRLPIVGRLSMDSMTVDITATPSDAIAEGDFVDLIGQRQTLDEVAADAGTIPYEILTRLGDRHARVYIDGDVTNLLMPGEAR